MPPPPPPPPPPSFGAPPTHAPTPPYTGPAASGAGSGQKTNALAITSLVLGILSVFVCWCFGIGAVLGIGAVVTGLVGRSQIRDSAGLQQGDGMALAGVITGAVAIALSLLWLVIAVIAN